MIFANRLEVIAPSLDISTATFVQKSSPVLTHPGDPKSLIVTEDGTKLFIASRGGNLYRYDFGTPYDVSTLSFVNGSSPIHNFLNGYDIKPDGTKIWTVSTDGIIREYDLTTPYNPTTFVSTQSALIDDVTTDHLSPSFSRDGTKLYVFCNGAPDSVSQYSLSTPWDISTLSFVSNRGTFSGSSADFRISDDGSHFFFVHTNDARYLQYDLSTPYDVQTATQRSGLGMTGIRNGEIVQSAGKVYLHDVNDRTISEYNL